MIGFISTMLVVAVALLVALFLILLSMTSMTAKMSRWHHVYALNRANGISEGESIKIATFEVYEPNN